MPRKDGLDEPSIRQAEATTSLLAKDIALSVLGRVIDLWNDSHCADCFATSLVNFRSLIEQDKIILRHIPEGEEPQPEKE